MDRWLTRGRYFHLNIASNAPRNPEYRLADDVRVATESPIEFAIGATTAILSAATFVIVLWTIGGALTIHWNGAAITIPGFLVVAAVVYAAAASGLMLVIGRNFVAVSESMNSAEAEKVLPSSAAKERSASGSTGLSPRSCARGESFAFSTCGPRSSRKRAG